MQQESTIEAIRNASEALFKAPHRLELAVLIARLHEPELSVVQLHDLMIERHLELGEQRVLDRSSVSRNLKRLRDAGLLEVGSFPGTYRRVSAAFWDACVELLHTIESQQP